MRPCKFQHRLVFFGIKCITHRIYLRRNCSKQIYRELNGKVIHVQHWRSRSNTNHIDNLRVHSFRQYTAIYVDILQNLLQCLSLNFLLSQLGRCIAEIKNDRALSDLLDKEVLAEMRWNLWHKQWEKLVRDEIVYESESCKYRETQASFLVGLFPWRRIEKISVYEELCWWVSDPWAHSSDDWGDLFWEYPALQTWDDA